MNVAKQIKPMSLEEFEAMPKEEYLNYELIDGIVLMSPRPSLQHQVISGNLYAELRTALREMNCKPVPEVDLILNGNNLIPDLMVVCNDELKGKRYEKPPLIIIEIVSPSSVSRDYFTKRYKYEQLGVKEYWIVSPDEKCIEILCFAEDKHIQYCSGQIKSCVLPEIQIDIESIFE